MIIHVELTPNPNAIKFITEIDISPDQPIHFGSLDEARIRSSLASELFSIKSVKSVFFGSHFITITKDEEVSWDVLTNEVISVITDYITFGKEILDKEFDSGLLSNNNNDITEIEKQIIEIIETRVRPSVAMDGGDIVYKGFKNGIVGLELRGSCAGCPSSIVTLKDGIESMLKHFVPEVKSVEAV
jgi:Fe-S cluster biogenesis protein NfuA